MFILIACYDSKTTLFLKINNTEGLREKAKVKMNGLQIGHIGKINLDNDYRIIAEIILDKGIMIPKDTKFSLYTEDIMGTKSIELTPGIKTEKFKNRDTIFELLLPNVPLDSLASNIINIVQKNIQADNFDSLEHENKRLNKKIDSLKNEIKKSKSY
jgi:phospholipid/cholesterol/gamma-HCH transport system substrate-binding protein